MKSSQVVFQQDAATYKRKKRYPQKEQLHLDFYEKGDSKTLASLVNAYEKLVHSQAHKMELLCAEPHEDLFQMGCYGLVKALRKFNPHLGVAFSSFAVPFIRGQMLHHLRDHAAIAKVPRKWHEMYSRSKSLEKNCPGITIDQQAEIIETNSQELALIKEACQLARSSTKELPESVVAGNGCKVSGFDYSKADEPLQAIAAKMQLLFNSLPDTDKNIIKMLYVDCLSIEKAAKKMHISPRHLSNQVAKTLIALAAQSISSQAS